jgi:hypothetical protein
MVRLPDNMRKVVVQNPLFQPGLGNLKTLAAGLATVTKPANRKKD